MAMKPAEHFGRCKPARPAFTHELHRLSMEYHEAMRRRLLLSMPPPTPLQARLRSLGSWLMGSRFGFLRSLGGRLLRTGALF